MPLGEDGIGLVLRILSFNLGVELGQVLALSVMLLILAGWREAVLYMTKSSNKGGQHSHGDGEVHSH